MAIEYYEKASQILFLTGLMNDELFHPSQFLKEEIQYLRGMDIPMQEWEDFTEKFVKIDKIWRSIIFTDNIEIEEDRSKRKYISFYVRTISKICGNFEELGNYSVENINNMFEDLIKKLESLIFNLESLVECDISRLRELYKERISSSDNLWILKSLNKIDKSIIKGREEFEIDDIISPIVNLGYNINTYIKRYVNYITSNQ